LADKVKAMVFSEPGKMHISRFDRPEVDEDSILLKVEMVGVCGTDLHIFKAHLSGVPFPIIPGHEILGIVEELGKRANERMVIYNGPLETGDRVTLVAGIPCGECFYCRHYPHYDNLCTGRKAYGITRSCEDPPHLLGGYAEYMYLLPGTSIFKVPKRIPAEAAVLTEPLAVASRAVERAFQPGVPFSGEGFGLSSSVVIQGAGPIGILATAVAKAAGAGEVIAIDSVDTRLKMVKEFGADFTIDLRELKTSEERINKVLELTDGHGADVVIECAGIPAAFKEGLEMVRRGGKYIEVGHYTDAGPIDIRPHTICKKDVDILGCWAYPRTQFKKSLSLLDSGGYPFEKLVTHKLSIDEAPKAFSIIEAKEAIKVAIVP